MITAKTMAQQMRVKGLDEINAAYARARGKRFHPGEVTGDPVYARIENDRLIADCECSGAEYVDPDDLRFYCHGCENKSNNGAYRPVILPEEANN